jgi:hypothetical protein
MEVGRSDNLLSSSMWLCFNTAGVPNTFNSVHPQHRGKTRRWCSNASQDRLENRGKKPAEHSKEQCSSNYPGILVPTTPACMQLVCERPTSLCTISGSPSSRLLPIPTPALDITIAFDLNNNVHVLAPQVLRYSASHIVQISMA